MQHKFIFIVLLGQLLIGGCASSVIIEPNNQDKFRVLLIGEYGTSPAKDFAKVTTFSILLGEKLSEVARREVSVFDYTQKEITSYVTSARLEEIVENVKPQLVYYLVTTPQLFSRDLVYQNIANSSCPFRLESSWFNENTVLNVSRENFLKISKLLNIKNVKFNLLLAFDQIEKMNFISGVPSCKPVNQKNEIITQENIILYLQKKNIPLLSSKKLRDSNTILLDKKTDISLKTPLYESSFSNNLIPWVLPDID